jgi:hypothetical protein
MEQLEIIGKNLSDHKFPNIFINDAHALMGMWFDSKDNLYSADYRMGKVRMRSSDSNWHTIL